MTGSRPGVSVRTFDTDFPDPQTRPPLRFENAVCPLELVLHVDKGLIFWFIGGLSR